MRAARTRILATSGAWARRRSTSDSPAAARTRRSSRGEASIGSRCSSSPARRTRPRGWRWFRRCGGGGESRGAEEGRRRGRTRGWTDRPSRQPRRGTGPSRFPISASASGDGGALLALAMIDGSVVLFNARLGAVAENVSANREITVRASTATADRAASCARRRQLCLGTDGEHAVGDRRALPGRGTRATNDAPARSSPPPKPAGWPSLTSTRPSSEERT